MPAPLLLKTWQFSINMVEPASGSTGSARVFLRVKNALKGFALNPWTVLGSSDAATAGMDNTDRLTDLTKIVNSAAGSRSWIVLRSPAGQQVCIEWNHATYQFYGTVAVSKNSVGFTGGSTTARPTATDEILLGTGGSNTPWGPMADTSSAVVHVLHSTDGLSTQVHLCRQGDNVGMWLFGKAPRHIPEWTDPLYNLVMGSVDGGITNAHLWNTSNNYMKGWRPAGAGPMDLYATPAEVFYSNSPWPSVTASPDAYTQEYPLVPYGLYSNTAGASGRHGVLPDFWLISSATVSSTTMHEKRFAVLTNHAIPWDSESNLQMTV
jgi:hypothetical protein